MPLPDVIEALVLAAGALEEVQEATVMMVDGSHEAREGPSSMVDGNLKHAEGVWPDMLPHKQAPDLPDTRGTEIVDEATLDFSRND